jgi:hypothetical protein
MASGHMSRTRRPNTWLIRPDCDVQKVLATMEPSTHGTLRPRDVTQCRPYFGPGQPGYSRAPVW